MSGSSPTPFSVSVDEQPDRTVIAVAGELDLATAPELEAALLPRLRDGGHAVLDLRALDFMDSTGVRVIVAGHVAAQEHGGRFALVRTAPDAPVGRVLEISGLDGVLELVDEP
ncbi:MAG TPA: STAS domain-containing protein [Baekduia sp.]|uniref:STAS domain-containing protein n=1 Tax=Baekduia sp. TaxID=2600305 RepID=UPI002BE07D7E|nr:STAS domain-containing protein [Baekduia sp.]HMJ34674.1 STAS domain-containing protein [Baekduia sp.]